MKSNVKGGDSPLASPESTEDETAAPLEKKLPRVVLKLGKAPDAAL